MACSAARGMNGVGEPVQCLAVETLAGSPAVAVDAGGPVNFAMAMSSGTAAPSWLPGCETYDVAYFTPHLSAYFAAMVAVLCVKFIHARFFRNPES